MAEVEEFIGVDVGTVRTGLARGSSAARLAQPLKTVDTKDAIDEISELASELKAAGVVVGQPRNLSGEDTKQTQWVRGWVEQTRLKIKLPFYAHDEALTSVNAQAEAPSGKETVGVDARAAAAILQDFLDTPETERVVW